MLFKETDENGQALFKTNDNPYMWNGMPSPLLTRISMAVASSMDVLLMIARSPNSPSTVNFS